MDLSQKTIQELFYNQIKVLTLNSFDEFKMRRHRRLILNGINKARRVQ